jgi:hypothetical protein
VLRPLIAVVLLLAAPSSSPAEERMVPSWMIIDAGAKKVLMDAVSR